MEGIIWGRTRRRDNNIKMLRKYPIKYYQARVELWAFVKMVIIFRAPQTREFLENMRIKVLVEIC
jgi:hypothetical protein